MTERSRLGQKGEDAAVRYLKRKGFRILDRNYSALSGEIDVIALKGKVLCFVEVKTRSGDHFDEALDSITPHKQQVLRRTAEIFIDRLRENEVDYDECQFDAVIVLYDEHGRCDLEHFENIC